MLHRQWSEPGAVLVREARPASAGDVAARRRVVGKTDSIGGTIADRPVSPKDALATIYHLLGYDLETTLTDRTNCPVPLAPAGR